MTKQNDDHAGNRVDIGEIGAGYEYWFSSSLYDGNLVLMRSQDEVVAWQTKNTIHIIGLATPTRIEDADYGIKMKTWSKMLKHDLEKDLSIHLEYVERNGSVSLESTENDDNDRDRSGSLVDTVSIKLSDIYDKDGIIRCQDYDTWVADVTSRLRTVFGAEEIGEPARRVDYHDESLNGLYWPVPGSALRKIIQPYTVAGEIVVLDLKNDVATPLGLDDDDRSQPPVDEPDDDAAGIH